MDKAAGQRSRRVFGTHRVEEAIAQFERLLADRTRVLGADHPNTLNTRNNLAYLKQQR
jgi:Tetratricopeptide repeat